MEFEDNYAHHEDILEKRGTRISKSKESAESMFTIPVPKREPGQSVADLYGLPLGQNPGPLAQRDQISQGPTSLRQLQNRQTQTGLAEGASRGWVPLAATSDLALSREQFYAN